MDQNPFNEQLELKKEILGKLQDGEFAVALEKDPKWKVLFAASETVKQDAIESLKSLDFSKADAKIKAIELQTIINFHDDFLSKIIEHYKRLYEEGLSSAESLGWIDQIKQVFYE